MLENDQPLFYSFIPARHFVYVLNDILKNKLHTYLRIDNKNRDLFSFKSNGTIKILESFSMYTHLSEPLYYCIFLFFFDCSIKIMVYHERQSRQLCALHVLNNLLQVKNS